MDIIRLEVKPFNKILWMYNVVTIHLTKSSYTGTKSEAVKLAREMAVRYKVPLLVYSKDNILQRTYEYKNLKKPEKKVSRIIKRFTNWI